MSLYIGAAAYGSCACLTCCAPGLPCCVAPCNSVNDDQADSDLDGSGDKVQLSPWLDSLERAGFTTIAQRPTKLAILSSETGR